MFINLYDFLIITIGVVAASNMSAHNGSKSAEKEQSWALVPFNVSQINLFPSFTEKKRTFRFEGIADEIVIEQNWDGQGVSAVVWEAAIELTNYVVANKSLKGARVLELGAGTGLVGIACSKLGAKVTVTDLREFLPFLSQNVRMNFAENDTNQPVVQELKWGEKHHLYNPNDYDIVIGADIVYIEDTFDDLLDTICYLCRCKTHSSVLSDYSKNSTAKRTSLLLSAKMRYSREEKFIAKLKRHFKISHVVTVKESKIHIYEGTPL